MSDAGAKKKRAPPASQPGAVAVVVTQEAAAQLPEEVTFQRAGSSQGLLPFVEGGVVGVPAGRARFLAKQDHSAVVPSVARAVSTDVAALPSSLKRAKTIDNPLPPASKPGAVAVAPGQSILSEKERFAKRVASGKPDNASSSARSMTSHDSEHVSQPGAVAVEDGGTGLLHDKERMASRRPRARGSSNNKMRLKDEDDSVQEPSSEMLVPSVVTRPEKEITAKGEEKSPSSAPPAKPEEEAEAVTTTLRFNVASGAYEELGGEEPMVETPVQDEETPPLLMAEASAAPVSHRDLEEKGSRKRRCNMIVGLVILVAVIGGIVGGVVASQRSGNSNNDSVGDNGPQPTLTQTPAPTLSPTAPPTLGQSELNRWKTLIETASPNTSFDNPTSPASQALDWMASDPYSATLSDEFLLQRFAIVTFWYSTNGDSWTMEAQTGWLSNESECNWADVVCFEDTDTVVQAIVKSSAGLSGTLPLELSLLTQLEGIQCPLNGVGGTLFTELGLLTNLLSLALVENNIGGRIPTELALLTLLQFVAIDSNDLIGPIPPRIGTLSQLQVLELSNNNLEGTIPTQLANLKQLTSLSFLQNQLTGTLPTELGLLSNLDFLDLSSNDIQGTLPSEYGNMPNLTRLRLDSLSLNQTSTIPSQYGQLTILLELSLDSLQLIGTVPTELGNLTSLTQLGLVRNRLTGTMPPSVCANGVTPVIDCLEIQCSCCVGSGNQACI